MNHPKGPRGPAQRQSEEPVVPVEPRRPDVRWGGMTETQALEAILGRGNLTENRKADLLRAMAEILDWQRKLGHRRGVILHGLYQELLAANGDVYEVMGKEIGEAAGTEDVPKSTVHRWKHPPEWESLRAAP